MKLRGRLANCSSVNGESCPVECARFETSSSFSTDLSYPPRMVTREVAFCPHTGPRIKARLSHDFGGSHDLQCKVPCKGTADSSFFVKFGDNSAGFDHHRLRRESSHDAKLKYGHNKRVLERPAVLCSSNVRRYRRAYGRNGRAGRKFHERLHHDSFDSGAYQRDRGQYLFRLAGTRATTCFRSYASRSSASTGQRAMPA